MGKKGLSADEKKEKLKGILQDAKEPLTLKQIEKLGAKAGVSQMTIKGIVEEMVADNLVDMDKIGSTNWYWSFPGKELNALQLKASQLEEEVQSICLEIEKAKQQKAKLESERQPSKEREAMLAELRELEEKKKRNHEVLAQMKENDPNKALKLMKQIQVCKDASIRWTDNTFELISYLKKKYDVQRKQALEMLQLKDDFDYPEYSPPSKRAKKKKA